MNGGIGRDAALPESFRESAQRADPTSMCAGSAEWSSHVHSSCRKNSLRKKGRTRRLKISCFFSNTNRFTQLGARLIDRACPPQDPDQVGMAN